MFQAYFSRRPATVDSIRPPTFVPYAGSEGYSPVAYLPQVAAALVARALDLDFIPTLYLMRFAGLAALTGLIAYAIAIVPNLSWAFLAISMLPAREEFGQGNDFCKKVTYRSDEDPKSVLAQFRNDYNPRIAVTVDMIATGTDVKPLECLLFLRDVKSRNYFEQMKGRGTRTLEHDDLKKVTPSAVTAKTHYVIVDAIGVTKSLKTASEPLITKPSVPLKDLAMGVMMGARDEDTVSSLAGRLARLNKQLDDKDQQRIREKAGGAALADIVGGLLAAIDPDRIEAKAREIAGISAGEEPSDKARDSAREQLVGTAAGVFSGLRCFAHEKNTWAFIKLETPIRNATVI